MTNNIQNAKLFNLFWENSKINKRTILKFAKKLREDARTVRNIPQLLYSNENLSLVKPKDAIAQLMTKRQSKRSFNNVALCEKQLGSLCFAFTQKDATNRLLPSAGGKYPIETYAFLFNVKSKLNKKIVYYNPDNHSLSEVGDCSSWINIKELFGIELEEPPAIFFVFVAIPERTTEKYGERGGRFILIEVGHYAQNLALRLATENLGGVLCGALHDDEIKKLLKLQNTNALVTLGFACGNLK